MPRPCGVFGKIETGLFSSTIPCLRIRPRSGGIWGHGDQIEPSRSRTDLEEEGVTVPRSNRTAPDLGQNRGGTEHKSAIACICRDSQGCLVDGFAKTIVASSAEQAEAMALLETLDFLFNSSIKVFEVHSDSLSLVQVVEEETTPNWEVVGLVDRIREKRKRFSGLTLAQCSRDANRPADWLARAQRQHYLPRNWVSYPR